jgi:hypothetical protein
MVCESLDCGIEGPAVVTDEGSTDEDAEAVTEVRGRVVALLSVLWRGRVSL